MRDIVRRHILKLGVYACDARSEQLLALLERFNGRVALAASHHIFRILINCVHVVDKGALALGSVFSVQVYLHPEVCGHSEQVTLPLFTFFE